jgi:hypothetical protein
MNLEFCREFGNDHSEITVIGAGRGKLIILLYPVLVVQELHKSDE